MFLLGGVKVATEVPKVKSLFRAYHDLRIAFFGSDHFSAQILDKLLEFHNNNQGKISSIDIITRSAKKGGRNLRKTVENQLGVFCQSRGLPTFRADSQDDITGLLKTKDFDLALAVSYGKLIPAEFINSMKCGSLNVHPSLLPKYRGSSPIQHTLMNDDDFTGVTIQTLHPSKFDRGEIIDQSKPIYIKDKEYNFESLRSRLGEIASEMLLKVINSGNFKKPTTQPRNEQIPVAAPRLITSAREIRWNEYNTRKIKCLNNALGDLYTFKRCKIHKKKKTMDEMMKVILGDITIDVDKTCQLRCHGEFKLDHHKDRLLIKTLDGVISVGKLKFQYCNEETPSLFMKNLEKRAGTTTNKFIPSK